METYNREEKERMAVQLTESLREEHGQQSLLPSLQDRK